MVSSSRCNLTNSNFVDVLSYFEGSNSETRQRKQWLSLRHWNQMVSVCVVATGTKLHLVSLFMEDC